MILQRLIEYYDRLQENAVDRIPLIGFSRERISFELVVDRQGTNALLNDLRTPVQLSSRKQPVLEPRWMTVPYRGDRSSNIKSNFLWDNSGYIFGRSSKSGADQKKQVDFLRVHRELLALAPNADLETILKFLENCGPEKYDLFPLSSEALDQNIAFRISGERSFLHDSVILQDAWQRFFDQDVESVTGNDLVNGKQSQVAVTHFLIGGVRGAQPTGASLCSFNDTAYTSHGLRSSLNAPVSLTHVFKYTTAMKELLSYKRRRIFLGDTTTTFWSDRPDMLEEVAEVIFGDAPAPLQSAPTEDRERMERVRTFLSQLRDGSMSGQAIEEGRGIGFYILGIAAPALSRISVRYWVQSNVSEMRARLAQHLKDTQLTTNRIDEPHLAVRRIVEATGRAEFKQGKFKGYDTDAVSPLIASMIARAVFEGTPYPPMLLAQLLSRLRTDGYVSHVRVAAIKACLVRNARTRERICDVEATLNTDCAQAPYAAGRLLAVMEKLQADSAGGSLNTTLKDRYFSTASSTPAAVFPTILRLSQHYLTKLPDEGQRNWTQLLLDRLTGKVSIWPVSHSLEEQGLFALGYYQQHEELYRKRITIGDSR